jgi:hypothetical protein
MRSMPAGSVKEVVKRREKWPAAAVRIGPAGRARGMRATEGGTPVEGLRCGWACHTRTRESTNDLAGSQYQRRLQ